MRREGSGIAIYHEHPEWFVPLFAELERRGVPHTPVRPGDEVLDPGGDDWPHELVFNRMSPSAHLRGGAQAIRYTLEYLSFLEDKGVRVVNGLEAFQHEVSKVRQLLLLDRLGLPYPRTRVVHDPARLAQSVGDLRFPLVVKPNVGGSGAGIARFDTAADLASAVDGGEIESSLDGTLLLQEYHTPKGEHITRVEVLGGRFFYAIRVDASGESFNLCPADLCRSDDPSATELGACPAAVPAQGYDPPKALQRAVERITAAAGMELGGVEYLESREDGQVYFYDVNALSNFVADAPRVIGFDPFSPLVDFLEGQLDQMRAARPREAVGAA